MLTFPPDFSFIVQIVSFLLLWALLKRLTFGPVMHVLEEREARSRGALADAEKLRASAGTAEAEYQTSLRQVRQAVLQEAEAARKATMAEQQQRLTTARAGAEAELSRIRSEVAAEVERARTVLATEARGIATLMAERVSGRSLP